MASMDTVLRVVDGVSLVTARSTMASTTVAVARQGQVATVDVGGTARAADYGAVLGASAVLSTVDVVTLS